MPHIVEGQELEDYFPHRGLNILLDRFESFSADEREAQGGAVASGEVLVQDGDAVGRDIFLRGGSSVNTMVTPALTEQVALVSLSSLREEFTTPGTAFFSTISKFVVNALPEAGQKIRTTVYQTRRRGAFCGYHGESIVNGTIIAECDILAFYAHPDLGTADAGGGNSGDKKTTIAPAKPENIPVDKSRFDWKPSSMVFIDRRVAFNAEKRTATYGYVYPEDHPHVPGHFPDNPVMMGIAQWIAVADALHHTRADLGLTENTITGSGRVLRIDGTLICEVRKLCLDYTKQGNSPVIISTGKIGFRDMVRPGEEIFIQIELLAPQD